jgi:hypothetical protein
MHACHCFTHPASKPQHPSRSHRPPRMSAAPRPTTVSSAHSLATQFRAPTQPKTTTLVQVNSAHRPQGKCKGCFAHACKTAQHLLKLAAIHTRMQCCCNTAPHRAYSHKRFRDCQVSGSPEPCALPVNHSVRRRTPQLLQQKQQQQQPVRLLAAAKAALRRVFFPTVPHTRTRSMHTSQD